MQHEKNILFIYLFIYSCQQEDAEMVKGTRVGDK
jgi:hypothetical protein